jgi:hypothetical protein
MRRRRFTCRHTRSRPILTRWNARRRDDPRTRRSSSDDSGGSRHELVEAYGAFNVERAITYLADDADISEMTASVGAEGVEGNPG